MSNNKKHENMNTQNNTEKRIWIEWSNKQNVIAQYKSIESFMANDWMQRHADNFGQSHLIAQTMRGWEKYTINNIFVVDANPVHNYGLDFKMWIHYTTNDGMNFMMELSTGGSSLTSAPLVRVNLISKIPVGFDWNDISNNTPEMFAEFHKCMNENLVEAFEFSSNVAYKKDRSVRHLLIEQCKQHNFIFA